MQKRLLTWLPGLLLSSCVLNPQGEDPGFDEENSPINGAVELDPQPPRSPEVPDDTFGEGVEDGLGVSPTNGAPGMAPAPVNNPINPAGPEDEAPVSGDGPGVPASPDVPVPAAPPPGPLSGAGGQSDEDDPVDTMGPGEDEPMETEEPVEFDGGSLNYEMDPVEPDPYDAGPPRDAGWEEE